jgi:hypothetical protein
VSYEVGPSPGVGSSSEENAKMAAINKARSYASEYFSKACEAYKPSLSCDSSNCIKSEEEVECGLIELSSYYTDWVKVPGANQYYGKLTCAFAGCLCEQACFNKPGDTPPPTTPTPLIPSPEPSGHLTFTSIMENNYTPGSTPESYSDTEPAMEDTTDSDYYEEDTTMYTYP